MNKENTLIEEMKKHILYEYAEWVKAACIDVEGTEQMQQLTIKSMENNLDILIRMVKFNKENNSNEGSIYINTE